MALYGVRVEYESDLKPFSFRFYTETISFEAALNNGEEAWEIVQTIVGNDVVCTNIHAWIRNVSPNQFDNRPINEPGGISVSNPIKPEIVTRVFFPVQSSYPYYWDLRARLDAGSLSGIGFQVSYTTLCAAAKLALQDMVNSDKIVSKTGGSMGTVDIPNEYFFHQLSKRHYNRTPSGG